MHYCVTHGNCVVNLSKSSNCLAKLLNGYQNGAVGRMYACWEGVQVWFQLFTHLDPNIRKSWLTSERNEPRKIFELELETAGCEERELSSTPCGDKNNMIRDRLFCPRQVKKSQRNSFVSSERSIVWRRHQEDHHLSISCLRFYVTKLLAYFVLKVNFKQ